MYKCKECGLMMDEEPEDCLGCVEERLIDLAEEVVCGFSPDRYVDWMLQDRGMTYAEAYHHLLTYEG